MATAGLELKRSAVGIAPDITDRPMRLPGTVRAPPLLMLLTVHTTAPLAACGSYPLRTTGQMDTTAMQTPALAATGSARRGCAMPLSLAVRTPAAVRCRGSAGLNLLRVTNPSTINNIPALQFHTRSRGCMSHQMTMDDWDSGVTKWH